MLCGLRADHNTDSAADVIAWGLLHATFRKNTSCSVNRVPSARLKPSYKTSFNTFREQAELCRASRSPHATGPPQVSWSLVVITQLSGCFASLSRVSSYTAGVFYWAVRDLVLPRFFFSLSLPGLLQSGTTIVTGWSWRSEHFTYMLAYAAEHGVSLMGGHYEVLDEFGFHGEKKDWRASFLLNKGERFTETLWAQINPEEITANIKHTHHWSETHSAL